MRITPQLYSICVARGNRVAQGVLRRAMDEGAARGYSEALAGMEGLEAEQEAIKSLLVRHVCAAR